MSLNSSAEHDVIDQTSTVRDPQHRRRLDLSLVIGIAAISVFLMLFIIEFSRILAITGRVNHVPPAGPMPLKPNSSESTSEVESP